MTEAVLYVHGKGGNAGEAEHYRALFPEAFVTGLDYGSEDPREAGKEIGEAVGSLKRDHGRVILIANSIGAFYSLYAGTESPPDEAWFISPLTDMEGMILWMLGASGFTEEDLMEKGELPGPFGETISREVLTFVREHPAVWNVKTHILYGEHDETVPYVSVEAFAEKTGADITVMENGEHWFHTPEEMAFLDRWITEKRH